MSSGEPRERLRPAGRHPTRTGWNGTWNRWMPRLNRQDTRARPTCRGCAGRGLSPRAPKRRPGQDRQRPRDLEPPWRGRPQAGKADNPAEQLRPVRENGERTTVCRLQGSRPLTLPQPSTRDREARGLLRVDPPKQKRTRRRRRPAELVDDAASLGTCGGLEYMLRPIRCTSNRRNRATKRRRLTARPPRLGGRRGRVAGGGNARRRRKRA